MRYLKKFNESSNTISDDIIQDCYDILLEVKDIGYQVEIEDINNSKRKIIFINDKLKKISDSHQFLMNVKIIKPIGDMIDLSAKFINNQVDENLILDSLDRLSLYLKDKGFYKYNDENKHHNDNTYHNGYNYIVRANKLNIYFYK